jgi:type IV pilus assembly protein PilP
MSWVKLVVPALASVWFLTGCGDSPQNPGAASAGPQTPQAGPAPQAEAGGGAKKAAGAVPSNLPPLPQREISERDFNESNRDPFKAYVEAKPVITVQKTQRDVLLSKYSLEECKIAGIITGDSPRVLINDPSGLGWVVHVGDFVGRAEKVHAGGASGVDVPVNWRVDRIRSNDVVFVREDPSRPDLQATTRVLSLRTADELNPEIRTGIPRSADMPPPPGMPGLPPSQGPGAGPSQPQAPPTKAKGRPDN